MNGVTLRVFSGVHLGAEISLDEGVCVIGSDDSCDLILEDSSLSARHAALRVALSERGPQMTVEPLDGVVTFNGEALTQEVALPPRRPFQIGLVTMAWTDDASAGNAAWQEVEERMVRAQAPETPKDAESPSTPTTSAPETDDANNAGGEPQKEELSLDAEKEPPRSRRSGSRAGKIGAVLALALIALLSFTWSNEKAGPSPEQRVRALLDEAGYQKLTVTGGKNGVTVTGRIASDRERGRLLRLAQFLHFPVYLDLTVRSDAAEAVKTSFNTLGLFPEVTELPPSTHPGLLVKGYIKNGVLEEQALTEAIRNVPDLQPSETTGKPKLALFRDIRHETDIQVLLAPALASAGLSTVKTEYLPGKIVLHGAFTPQTKAALEEAVATVQKELGVPVVFNIINDSDTLLPVKQENIYAKEERQRPERPTPSVREEPSVFRVSSVSMGPMKFITLSGGERVFEGGELPGGYVLEKISVDELTLSKNNKTTIYPLRGSHE
ncbi:type III secretion system inner membrane ring subunit SctD [Mailhella sp.]|uniref:type III secretion system inner membrane ring subunit SctD n=1 Tax=Mailhella sp. TaxID=1981029 RepID=UPI003AB90695